MKNPPRTAEEYVERLIDLDQSVPMTEAEAAEILREAGIDPDAELKRSIDLVDDAIASEEHPVLKALLGEPGAL